MTTRSVLAISVLAAILSAGLLFAVSGGNGDFPFHAAAWGTGGGRFARETGTDRYPWGSGSTVQASSLTALELAGGQRGPGGRPHSRWPAGSGAAPSPMPGRPALATS